MLRGNPIGRCGGNNIFMETILDILMCFMNNSFKQILGKTSKQNELVTDYCSHNKAKWSFNFTLQIVRENFRSMQCSGVA